ncbi:MAG: lipoyl synthase [Kiritimatiellae bacterium]|nr:lipoyl synthase [Kiritimatiellia bacterium]
MASVCENETTPAGVARKPPWLRVRLGGGEVFRATGERLRSQRLHTVCEEANCPNRGHCWSCGRATIMILGGRCTRACRFCNVTQRPPPPPEADEPERVARAVRESGLHEIVITSVTRDDLSDGGASHWAATIASLRTDCPGVTIEVLVPDFGGDTRAVALVLEARPDVFGHNLETVPRLYPSVRPQARFDRSLAVLRQAADAGLIVKTSLMLGLGEREDEVLESLRLARGAGVSILYLGQYLQPSPRHLPVADYLTPETFERLGQAARALGFGFVASAPLVRSSFHEEGQTAFVRARRAEVQPHSRAG